MVKKSEEVKRLEAEIERANKEYYTGDATTITYTDKEYDEMINKLHSLDPKNSMLKKVGHRPQQNRVELPYTMGSLQKAQTEKDITNKIQNLSKRYNTFELCISDKLDGISALYMPKNKKLYTRGDGKIGQDVSWAVQRIQNLPSSPSNVQAVRGELVISHTSFQQHLSDRGANIRNLVSGTMNSKVPDKEVIKHVKFIAYELLDPSSVPQCEQFERLNKAGFECAPYEKATVKDTTYQTLSQHYQERLNNTIYPIDGIVITVNAPYEQSSTSTSPYGFAFKLSQQEQARATTTVKEIQWNPSRMGKLVPTIHIDPVYLGGVQVSSITGHNAQYVISNRIGKGACVEFIRSGDVIPKIEAVKTPSDPEMPNTQYEWRGPDIYTVQETDEQSVRQMQHFLNALNVKGIQRKSLQRIVSEGYDTIYDLLSIDEDTLKTLFGENQGAQMYQTIRGLYEHDHEYAQLMNAAQPFPDGGIGVKIIRTIQKAYPEPHKYQLTQRHISSIEGIGTKTAEQFIAGLPQFQEFLERSQLPYYVPQEESEGGKMQDMKVVITGKRSQELRDFIEARGGTITDSISNTTSVLVNNGQSQTTTKITKARNLDIPVYSQDELYNAFR